MEKKYNNVSVFSKILNQIIKLTSLKTNYLTEKNTKKLIQKTLNKKQKVPKIFALKMEKNTKMKVYSYNGSIEKPKEKIIVYLHGGAYIEEIVAFQIRFAMKIAKKNDTTLIIPIYPLAPKYTYKDTYDLMVDLYEQILKTEKDIYFLGDSAGGGFCLSYSMYLRENNKKQPKKLLLLSPWLDITLENPLAKKIEKKDTSCAIEGTRYAGKLWAGESNLKNYLVSPLYGKFDDLPEITIATGEFDTMQPDCLELSNILKKKKINHNYIEYKGQSHDFGIYPTKEGKLLIEDFVEIIRGGDNNE